MGKYLNGSSKTGAKICNNGSLYSYQYRGSTAYGDGSVLYEFNWAFDGQRGRAAIIVKDGKISNSSILDTVPGTAHGFDRPLGLYNDLSLISVFSAMMSSIGIPTCGVYSDAF